MDGVRLFLVLCLFGSVLNLGDGGRTGNGCGRVLGMLAEAQGSDDFGRKCLHGRRIRQLASRERRLHIQESSNQSVTNGRVKR